MPRTGNVHMKSSVTRSKRLLFCLLPLLIISSQSGCAVCRNRSRVASALSDYWGWRAERARFAEAKAAHKREQKAMEEAHAYSEGTLEEVVKTDYTITLEKGMEVESIGIDYEEVKKMEKLDAMMKAKYDKAMKAYTELKAQAEEARLNSYMANAEAAVYGSDGCAPTPSCAQPPGMEEAIGPPPTLNSVGMENLPIVIRARYKLTPRQSSYARTAVERRYQPGKEMCKPGCCPRCGDAACTQSGRCTNYAEPGGAKAGSSRMINEPHAAPASEARRRPASNVPNDNNYNYDNIGLEELLQPDVARVNLFEGELEPTMLSLQQQ